MKSSEGETGDATITTYPICGTDHAALELVKTDDDGRNVPSQQDYRPSPVEESANQATRRLSNPKTSGNNRRQENATIISRMTPGRKTGGTWRRKRSARSKAHGAAFARGDKPAAEAEGAAAAAVSPVGENEERAGAGESVEECCVWVARADGSGGKVILDAPCGGGGA